MSIRFANLEELNNGRKKLKVVGKRIGDLVVEQRALQEAVNEYEKSCRHIWSKRKYIIGKDQFERICDLCNKVTYSKE
jgi:hypothetical protein